MEYLKETEIKWETVGSKIKTDECRPAERWGSSLNLVGNKMFLIGGFGSKR